MKPDQILENQKISKEHLCLHPYLQIRKTQNDRVCMLCGEVICLPYSK